MSRTITQRELRNECAAVLREVQAGQTLIVTRNGVPVAELRPIQLRRFVPRVVIAEAAAGIGLRQAALHAEAMEVNGAGKAISAASSNKDYATRRA